MQHVVDTEAFLEAVIIELTIPQNRRLNGYSSTQNLGRGIKLLQADVG